ncbi:hypothetical protein HDV01_005056 [Terramyces sp. JEL0728]|nr:hypothetical protein HDV01_005056 [Terramyces sp. JEL0728]
MIAMRLARQVRGSNAIGMGFTLSTRFAFPSRRWYSEEKLDSVVFQGEQEVQEFTGVSQEGFSSEILAVLNAPINGQDVEVTPDGHLYLPEIKEYALFARGRFISQARGEQAYFSEEGIPTATEGCKSNALMRCCKDLGIAFELWDPRFIRRFKSENIVMVQGVHVRTGQTKWLYKRKEDTLDYPYKEKEVPSKTFKK